MGLGVPAAVAEKLSLKTLYMPAGVGKAGGTAGWTTANDTGDARCPASQTASTFTVPVVGLQVGDIIKAFTVNAQIESGGNTVTLDCSLRKLTNAAADPADTVPGAITQVSVTADTAVSASKTLGTAQTVAADEMYYLLFTATTGASTDIRLLGVGIEIDRA